jgi:hypothetical protein
MHKTLFKRFSADHAVRQTRTKRTLGFDDLEGRQLLSLGAEFPINSITRATEGSPVTASSSNGSSVAVWTHSFGTGIDLQAQRFNAQGLKVGPQMFVAGKVGVNMTQPSVAMDAHGDFVVSWTQSPGSGGSDVFAQKFNANGVAINGVVPVGTGTFAESQSSASMDAAGDFVVAYTRNTNNTTPNVFAKIYNTNSQLLSVTSVGGTEFVEDSPSVSMAPNGLFDVAYQIHPNTSTVDVFANRYAFNGALLGEFEIAGGPPVGAPSISIDIHDNAVVAYQQFDGNNWDIFARRLNSNNTVGGVITVAATPTNEMLPSVALQGNGGAFVVAYQSFSSAKVTEVNAANHVISTQTAGSSRFFPHVSINGQNKYLLAYMVNNPSDNEIAGRFGLL